MPSDLPLHNLRIVVTRAAEQASTFSDRLRHYGALPLELPTLEVVPPADPLPLQRAISQLDHFTLLLLTSANGVAYFCRALQEQNRDPTALDHLTIAVVGQKTAAALTLFGLTADIIPPEYIADALPDALIAHGLNLSHQHILFPRVACGGRDTLIDALCAAGARVTAVPAYDTQCPTHPPQDLLEAIANETVDILTFTSSKTVRHCRQMLPHWQPQRVQLASIGPQTSITCRQLFGRTDIEAMPYTLDGLLEAIIAATVHKNLRYPPELSQ